MVDGTVLAPSSTADGEADYVGLRRHYESVKHTVGEKVVDGQADTDGAVSFCVRAGVVLGALTGRITAVAPAMGAGNAPSGQRRVSEVFTALTCVAVDTLGQIRQS